jgi:serine/threonine protein kinase
MGVVYRATQLALSRPVALKAIAPQFAEDAAYRERFKRESHLAASIDHPNVIPVYEAGELDDMLYLIMRWVDGTDLGDRLRTDGALSPADAITTLRPVASALAAAHRRGLVHRDVKPANVLIASSEGEDEHVYLTDFGIARRTDGEGAMTRTGALVGTLDYTAPERIQGGTGTPESDIYAFGCMLFEALTGHIPFDRPTELAKMHAHLNDVVPRVSKAVPEASAQLDEIVAKTMAKDPAERFESAAELATALDRALDEAKTGPVAHRRRVERAELPTDETEVSEVSRPGPTGHPITRPESVVEVPGPAAGAGRSGRPRALLGGGVGLLIVAAIVVVLVASGGGGKAPSSSSRATATVVRGSLRVSNPVSIGAAPADMSADQSGTVWLALPARSELMERTSGSSRVFPDVGKPSLTAAWSGGVWLAETSERSVALFTDGHLSDRVTLAGTPTALTADPGNGSAWVADESGRLTHIEGGRVVQQIDLSPTPTALGVAYGQVWGANGALVRVGLRHGALSMFEHRLDTKDITFDQGVWTARADGHLARFNPHVDRLRVNAEIRVSAPAPLSAVSAVENSPALWAISSASRCLYEIAVDSSRVVGTLRFSRPPVSLAATSTSVWVATADGSLFQVQPGPA